MRELGLCCWQWLSLLHRETSRQIPRDQYENDDQSFEDHMIRQMGTGDMAYDGRGLPFALRKAATALAWVDWMSENCVTRFLTLKRESFHLRLH